MFGSSPEGADETLELASGDGEHASRIRLKGVGMRDAFLGQQCLPGLGPVVLIPNEIPT